MISNKDKKNYNNKGFKLVDCIRSVDLGQGKVTKERVLACVALAGKVIQMRDEVTNRA